MPKTTMNLRVDSKLKQNAEKITRQLGLSTSSAITLFLKALVRERGLPFSVSIDSKNKGRYGKTASSASKENDSFDSERAIDQESIKDAIDKL
jgi:DNA-damage-inducible protein J